MTRVEFYKRGQIPTGHRAVLISASELAKELDCEIPENQTVRILGRVEEK